jgi:hypothetical protein
VSAAVPKRRGQSGPRGKVVHLAPRRFKAGPVCALLLTVALAAVVAPMAMREDDAPPAHPAEPALKTEVRAVLHRLRGTWVPRSVEELGLSAEADYVLYQPALAEILASPTDPLFREAVQLAVLQDQLELAPLLRAAIPCADEETAQLLVAAVERLEPWTDAELVELLGANEPGVVVAALRVAGARAEPPVDPMLPLLTDATPAIRAAALASLPRLLPAAAGSRILAVLSASPEANAAEALLALARCPAGPEIDAVLYAQLQQMTGRAGTALDSLARRGGPLGRPDVVRRVALDEASPVATRARAFRCLEATGTPADLDAVALARLDDPLLEYQAARALLLAQRPEALDLLLQIVRQPVDGGDEAEGGTAQEARLGARQLLAMLADTSNHADVSTWEAWASQRPAVKFERLPPSPVVFPD